VGGGFPDGENTLLDLIHVRVWVSFARFEVFFQLPVEGTPVLEKRFINSRWRKESEGGSVLFLRLEKPGSVSRPFEVGDDVLVGEYELR